MGLFWLNGKGWKSKSKKTDKASKKGKKGKSKKILKDRVEDGEVKG